MWPGHVAMCGTWNAAANVKPKALTAQSPHVADCAFGSDPARLQQLTVGLKLMPLLPLNDLECNFGLPGWQLVGA